ncbi:MAG: hypothetical protein ACXWQZ_20575 [Ktedonobacterales bacterium]
MRASQVQTQVQTQARPDVSLSRVERVIAACLPSAADVIFLSVLLGVLLGLQGRALGYDGDSGWNIRIGQFILDHGIPRKEFLLSTTYGQPHVYWEWLSQTFYAIGYRVGGLNGVVLLAALLVALTGTGLLMAMRDRGLPLLLALGLALLGTALTSITWTARSQLFSLLLTLCWSECIWRYWRDGNPRRLWFFPITMVLWANLHGGFLGGLILLGVAVGVAWIAPHRHGKANPRHLTFALLGTLAATLVTPWGIDLYSHILWFFRNPLIVKDTQEHQSPDFHMLSGQVFMVLTFAIVATWMYALWMRQPATSPTFPTPDSAQGAEAQPQRTANTPEPLALAQVGVWTALSLISVRYIPLWALLATPVLGDALVAAARVYRASQQPNASNSAPTGTAGRLRIQAMRMAVVLGRRATLLSQRLEATDRLVGKGVWASLALIFVAATVAHAGIIPGTSTRLLDARYDAHTFPVQAAQELHANGLPSGVGFTTYEWGGYLDYALPEYHVFIDSRSDVYSAEMLGDYASIIGLDPGWQQTMDRYHVRWALIPAGSPLEQMLAISPGWHCAALGNDGVAALCTRTT